MVIGEIKQYIIPLGDEQINKTINFNNDLGSNDKISYQIGIIIDEKAYMALGQNNTNFQITINYTNGSNSVITNNNIEIGRTYIYEPGDSLTIDSINLIYQSQVDIYESNQMIKKNLEDIGKIYLDVIALNKNEKKQSDYIIEEEES